MMIQRSFWRQRCLFQALLLLVGFLLCVSIVWAAVSFLMMGLGLICLLIAGRRNKTYQRRLVNCLSLIAG